MDRKAPTRRRLPGPVVKRTAKDGTPMGVRPDPPASWWKLLDAALDPFDPPRDWKQIADRAGVSYSLADRLRGSAEFRIWWSHHYLARAAVYTAPVVAKLVETIHHPKTSPNARVAAIREFLSRYGDQAREAEQETALRALVEALSPVASLKGKKVRFVLRQGDLPGQAIVAAEVADEEAPPAPEPADRLRGPDLEDSPEEDLVDTDRPIGVQDFAEGLSDRLQGAQGSGGLTTQADPRTPPSGNVWAHSRPLEPPAPPQGEESIPEGPPHGPGDPDLDGPGLPGWDPAAEDAKGARILPTLDFKTQRPRPAPMAPWGEAPAPLPGRPAEAAGPGAADPPGK